MPAAPVAAPPVVTAPVVAPPVSPKFTTPSSPAPPAKAESSSPSAPPPANPESTPMDDAFKDLDDFSKKPEPPKPEPKKTEEPELEPEQDPNKTTDPEKGKPGHKATLRAAYDNLKKQYSQLEQEVKQLRQPVRQEENPELKTLKERYEAAEKRRTELEDEIRFASYERSPEYQEKYQKPFEDAYNWGRQSIARLKVNLEDGTTRQATPEDFDKILLIADDGDAVDLAEQMFGNKSKIVLDHRWELKKLDAARYRAIEDFKKVGGERETKMREMESKRNEQMGQMWKQLNGEAAERFPKWFKPEEGDEEGNRLLEEGYKLADAAFSRSNGMSPEDTVRLHASIRHRAAAFTREVYRNKKMENRIAELEKELEQFKSSEPGPGDGNGGPAQEKSWEDMLVPDA